MQSFVERVLERLRAENVEFAVAGAMSAVLQGAPVVTQDLDLCDRRTPENIRRLGRALAPLHPRLRGFPNDLPAEVDEHTLRQATNLTLDIDGESFVDGHRFPAKSGAS